MEALAMAAATALVSAMATSAWQTARSAVLALWQRAHPDRVATLEAQLGEVRTDLLAGDPTTAQDLTNEWRRKLLHLLQDDPLLEAELRRVLDEQLTPLLPPAEQQRVHKISMTATASGHAQVIQAGHDVKITKNDRP